MRWTVYEGKMSKCVTQVSPKSNCLLGSQGVRNMRTREASKMLSPTALNPLLLSERRIGNVHYRHSASHYGATRKIELGKHGHSEVNVDKDAALQMRRCTVGQNLLQDENTVTLKGNSCAEM